jgi:hypothetical protein
MKSINFEIISSPDCNFVCANKSRDAEKHKNQQQHSYIKRQQRGGGERDRERREAEILRFDNGQFACSVTKSRVIDIVRESLCLGRRVTAIYKQY